MLSFFATKKHDVYNRNSLTHIEGQMTPARRKIRAALLIFTFNVLFGICLLYTSPSPRDGLLSRMPSSA